MVSIPPLLSGEREEVVEYEKWETTVSFPYFLFFRFILIVGMESVVELSRPLLYPFETFDRFVLPKGRSIPPHF